MTAKSMRKGTGALELLSFVLLMVFFIGIALIDGPEWCVDTPSYVYMDFSREPVYPLFLMGIRIFFERLGITSEAYGLPAYLAMAVALQSILWAVAVFRLGVYVYDVTKDTLSEKRARLLMILAEVLQVAVACINRFVAKRGSMYSESLMTESIAMPLFVLFTILLLKSFDNYNIANCIKLFLLGTLISSVRKQMLIVVLMWGFCSFVLHLFVKRYRSLQKFSYTVIFVVITLVAIAMFDRGYNLAVRGVFAGHTGNSKGGLCTLLYTADQDDAELYSKVKEFPEMEALFTRIMSECESQGLTITSAPEGDWVAMVDHYALSYDIIGFDVILPICNQYVAEHYPELEGVSAQIMEDKVEKKLFNTLLFGHIKGAFKGEEGDMIYVFWANVLKAFVISNANISPAVLIKVSLIIYGVYLALYIFFAISVGVKGDSNRMLLLGFVVMTGLAINCVVTGSMIFPQPRYMCYSMGLFYLSLCSLVIARK